MPSLIDTKELVELTMLEPRLKIATKEADGAAEMITNIIDDINDDIAAVRAWKRGDKIQQPDPNDPTKTVMVPVPEPTPDQLATYGLMKKLEQIKLVHGPMNAFTV